MEIAWGHAGEIKAVSDQKCKIVFTYTNNIKDLLKGYFAGGGRGIWGKKIISKQFAYGNYVPYILFGYIQF